MSKLIAQYEEALSIESDEYKIIDLKNNIALELRDSDSDRALLISHETLKASQALEYELGIAWAKLNIGFQNDFLGQKENVSEYLKFALDVFKKRDHLPGIAYAYKYLGFYYWGLGEVDKAFEMMYLGLEETKNTDTYYEGWEYYELAVFNFDLGKLKESKGYYQEALRIFEPLEYEHGWGRTYNGLCSIAIKEGKFDEAYKLGEKALAIHTQSNYNMGLSRTYYDLGIVLEHREAYDEAKTYYTKSLLIREQVKNISATITTLLALGKINLKLKDLDPSEGFLLRALHLAEQISAKAKTLSVTLLLIELYESKNNPQEAARYYKKAIDLQTEVYKEDAESKLKSVTNKFLAKQKEKEAEIHQLKNVELKNAFDQINIKNKELLLTIDELTKTRVKKKAITITLVFAIFLFILEELIVEPYIEFYTGNQYGSIGIKFLLALLLKPMELLIEKYMFNRILYKKYHGLNNREERPLV